MLSILFMLLLLLFILCFFILLFFNVFSFILFLFFVLIFLMLSYNLFLIMLLIICCSQSCCFSSCRSSSSCSSFCCSSSFRSSSCCSYTCCWFFFYFCYLGVHLVLHLVVLQCVIVVFIFLSRKSCSSLCYPSSSFSSFLFLILCSCYSSSRCCSCYTSCYSSSLLTYCSCCSDQSIMRKFHYFTSLLALRKSVIFYDFEKRASSFGKPCINIKRITAKESISSL